MGGLILSALVHPWFYVLAAADLLIAPANVMDQAAAAGRVVTATRVQVGRVGVGVMVHRDAKLPSVGTRDALKTAILAADRAFDNEILNCAANTPVTVERKRRTSSTTGRTPSA